MGSDKKKILLWVSGCATAVICLVMNLWLIPAIEKNTGGIRCFDMQSFGYTRETALRFLELIGDDGRSIYLRAQLPLDFIYPVCYTSFFSLLLVRLQKRATPLLALPILLAVSDYAENVCSIIMLRAMTVGEATAAFASACTVAKTALMYATILVIVVLALVRAVKKRRAGKQAA
ncbi:MAG: hypothetical protein K6C36_05010 [Clostridia bacterium]|nr:hypothetical protein [Clostridia bacterium]